MGRGGTTDMQIQQAEMLRADQGRYLLRHDDENWTVRSPTFPGTACVRLSCLDNRILIENGGRLPLLEVSALRAGYLADLIDEMDQHLADGPPYPSASCLTDENGALQAHVYIRPERSPLPAGQSIVIDSVATNYMGVLTVQEAKAVSYALRKAARS